MQAPAYAASPAAPNAFYTGVMNPAPNSILSGTHSLEPADVTVGAATRVLHKRREEGGWRRMWTLASGRPCGCSYIHIRVCSSTIAVEETECTVADCLVQAWRSCFSSALTHCNHPSIKIMMALTEASSPAQPSAPPASRRSHQCPWAATRCQ